MSWRKSIENLTKLILVDVSINLNLPTRWARKYDPDTWMLGSFVLIG